MPMPINDAAVALQKQGERTETALQKVAGFCNLMDSYD